MAGTAAMKRLKRKYLGSVALYLLMLPVSSIAAFIVPILTRPMPDDLDHYTWGGWNIQDRQSYVSNDETVYADDTSAGYSAENHPRWNGGSSSERSRFMQTAIYKAWRHDVFERDRYTCDTCGQVGGKLEAHHLESYHANEALRTDINNGVTLCARCHGDFHSQYGRISFTAADYQTFNRCNTNGNYRRPAVAKV